MDIKHHIASIQDVYLFNFDLNREMIQSQIVHMSPEDSNVTSHKHLQFLLRTMASLKEHSTMHEFMDIYNQYRSNASLMYLLGKKIDLLQSKVLQCREKYKEIRDSILYLKDHSYLFSVVLFANIWRKCWLYFCMRYDIIMRCIRKVKPEQNKEKTKALFAMCLRGDDIEQLVIKEGYSIFAQQDEAVDGLSNQILLGNNNSFVEREEAHKDTVQYLSTSNLFDSLVNSTQQARRLPYTREFMPQTQYTMAEYCSINKQMYYYYQDLPSVDGSEGSTNIFGVFQKTQKTDISVVAQSARHGIADIKIEESVIEQVSAAVSQERSAILEANRIGNLSFALGFAGSYNGYVSTMNRLRTCPMNGPLLDVNAREMNSNASNSINHYTRSWKCMYRFVNAARQNTNIYILLDFALTSFQLASVLISLSTGADIRIIDKIVLIAYFVVNIKWMWETYYYGNEIIVQSLNISVLIYTKLNWHYYDKKTKKGLSMIMNRAQKPLSLSIGPLADLSLQSFLTVLRATFSYLTFMTTMYE